MILHPTSKVLLITCNPYLYEKVGKANFVNTEIRLVPDVWSVYVEATAEVVSGAHILLHPLAGEKVVWASPISSIVLERKSTAVRASCPQCVRLLGRCFLAVMEHQTKWGVGLEDLQVVECEIVENAIKALRFWHG